MTRLINGLAGFVQHPTRQKIDVIHLLWAGYMLLGVAHFWWFEFAFSRTAYWTFDLYFFLITYSVGFYFACALLFPDDVDEYADYAGYFIARRAWFYGIMIALAVLDVFDSLLKGAEHFDALGRPYLVHQILFTLAALAGILVHDRRFHLLFAVGALAAQVWWVFARLRILE